MTPIDQSRPFNQRLNDFGPELGLFLGRVWNQRATINLTDFVTGTNTIYDLYSGSARTLNYNYSVLQSFVHSLTNAAGQYSIQPQSFNAQLSAFTDREIMIYGRDLWDDFFHVLSSPQPARTIRSRVYVHAANSNASINLMTLIIREFGYNSGLWEAKTAGPGSQRLDTIVCYLYDEASADSLVRTLQTAPAGLFNDTLPPLVKRKAPGIGVADEPPAVEIYSGEGTRHSFGSFFSTLCWVALKTTPNVKSPNADGRHMLDNMLFSLRVLQVDPRNPQRFPQAGALEAWYQAAVNG